jgi:hypothetical protein
MLPYIQAMYDDGDENYLIRKRLWHEITNSRHIVGSDIIEWDHSNPSAQPLTTTVNNLYNMFLHVYCWLDAHNGDLACLKDLQKHFSLNVFGDDSINAVSDEKLPMFNQETIRCTMLKSGIVYTDESKTKGSLPPCKPLSRSTFLKRGFRMDNLAGRTVGPLSMDTIHEMVNWSKKGADYDNIARTNVDVALHELSLHGEELYNSESKKLIEQSRKILGYQPPLIRWSDVFLETCGFEKYW